MTPPDSSTQPPTAGGSSRAQFQAELGRLVETFDRNLAHYKSSAYDEASLRQEFLNPLFRALGWDVENRAGAIPKHREVEIESRTEVGGRQKRADYLFRTDRRDRFVCEAKKPAEALEARYAFQVKRYAWGKDVALAILTDFEEIKVYIVGGKVFIDEPLVGLWKTWHFRDFVARAPEIWDLLAREQVAGGSIERLLDTLPRRPPAKGKARQMWLVRPDRSRAMDADFLNTLDEARRALASDLLRHNDRADLLEGTRLNDAVQRILDRILFLRICEDRDIDTGRPLLRIVQDWRERTGSEDGRRTRQQPLEFHDEPAAYRMGLPPEGSLWRELVRHFRALDRRPPSHLPFFNGNLFKPHFSEELAVGDDWLAGFLNEIGDEESSYQFSDVAIEILGTIYERFLGKIVRPHGRGVTIEEKPEVRKAGGVYYTPRYIVEYIVEETVGKLLTEATAGVATLREFAARTHALRILDPACGSGSFLIRAFERVCEHWQQRFTANPKECDRRFCWKDEGTGDVRLTSVIKRLILLSNIHGVDLDAGAVEVTQLSLYLKMLEHENRDTIRRERDLFGSEEPLLPALDASIKCGNSLIASDFSLVPEDLVRVHAFDWPVQFPAIMKAGGFDAVIGNPPYVRIQGFPQDQVAYFSRCYRAATGNYDIYANFVERGYALLNRDGRLGMIVPNKFLRTDYGIGLRTLLAEARGVTRIVDFGATQVFDATTYTCLLFLSQHPVDRFDVAVCDADAKALSTCRFESRPVETLGPTAWTLTGQREAAMLARIRAATTRLLDLPAEMSRGSSSGADEVFLVEALGCPFEVDVLRTPLFASDFGRYFLQPSDQWRIVFPYSVDIHGSRLLSSSELQRRAPAVFTHLQRNGTKLRARKQFREWYSYSAPRNLQLHDRAQIAVPLLANGPIFALIPEVVRGTLCPMASGGFTITLGAQCALSPEFVLGLLNSRLLYWCLRQTSNVFRGGWITCTKQYFGELPIVVLDLSVPEQKVRHDRLVELVQKMLALTPKLRAARHDSERATLQNAVTATDRQIDEFVYELYGLNDEDIALVEGAE